MFLNAEFFEKDLLAAQQRFNQTFGRQQNTNLKTRQQVIMAIVHMGLLCRRISSSKMSDETKALILRLLKVKETLNRIFENLENNPN